MISNKETLKIINSGNIGSLYEGISGESLDIIKNKINEIPSEFFERRISLDGSMENTISLIEFSMQVADMSTERKIGLMEKYHISPYDINTLQRIIDSIRVADTYGRREIREEEKAKKQADAIYGIALADESKIDKAYPLWLAFIYANSSNPLSDIKLRLEHDGVKDKYKAEDIVGLIEHTNTLMNGKSDNEKKDFYISSISGILDEDNEIKVSKKKNKDEIEI